MQRVENTKSRARKSRGKGLRTTSGWCVLTKLTLVVTSRDAGRGISSLHFFLELTIFTNKPDVSEEAQEVR